MYYWHIYLPVLVSWWHWNEILSTFLVWLCHHFNFRWSCQWSFQIFNHFISSLHLSSDDITNTSIFRNNVAYLFCYHSTVLFNKYYNFTGIQMEIDSYWSFLFGNNENMYWFVHIRCKKPLLFDPLSLDHLLRKDTKRMHDLKFSIIKYAKSENNE